MRRNSSHSLSLIAILCLAPFRLFGGWQDDIGLTLLKQEAGAELADGSNLALTMVEAWSAGRWAPDKSNPAFAGRTINYTFSDPNAYSAHATEVGRRLFGAESALPYATGIAAMDNSVWQMTVLGSGSAVPLDTGADLANHSWISWSTTNVEATLQRLDYIVDTFDTAQIVCVDNSSAFPSLLANSHNAIAVGSSTGSHSLDGTNREGSGRLKPDLVGTATFTSYATPVVSSAAGLILSRAKQVPALAAAGKTETLKAILLAGATKSEFPDWQRTQTRPLDPLFGAGEVNILHSYRILERGQRAPSSTGTPAASGWDFRTAQASSQTYLVEAPDAQLSELSVVLAWNRKIAPVGGDWNNLAATLANLDLKLWRTDESGAKLSLVDSSSSAADNVEHIWQTALPPGRYLIEVVSAAESVDYGLAWRIGDASESAASIALAGIANGSTYQLGQPISLGVLFTPNGSPASSIQILVDGQIAFQGSPAAASAYQWIPSKAGTAILQAVALLQNGSTLSTTKASVTIAPPPQPVFRPAPAIVVEISAPVRFPAFP